MVQKVQKGRDDERQSWTAPRLALTTGQMVQMVQKVQASEKYRLTQTRARFTPQRTRARPELRRKGSGVEGLPLMVP